MRLIDADHLDKRIYEEIPLKEFGTIKRMARMREIIEEEPTVGGWISVKDRLPEHVDRVPVLYRFADSELQDGKLHTAMLWYVREPFCGDEPPHWEWVGRYEYEVLYWFELPGAPKEVQG